MNTRQQTELTNGKSLAAHVGSRAVGLTRSVQGLLGIGGCVLLTSLAAQVRIPVPGTEVPMTLQLAAVLLTGFVLTPPRAIAAMLLYLGLGGAGVPVFAPGSAGLAGSTGGYLVGFVAAAWLAGVLKGPREASLVRLLVAGAAGTAAVFICGIAWRAWLAVFIGFLGGDIWLVFVTGVVPFLPKAAVEIGCAAALAKIWRGRDWQRRPQA